MASSNQYRDGNSGYEQLAALKKQNQDNSAIAANPVGPPAPVQPPTPDNSVMPGVRANPNPSQLAQDGALRPAAGAWSAANPQPMADGAGNVMRPNIASIPMARSVSSPTPGLQPLIPPPPNPELSNGIASMPNVTRPTPGGATSENGRPLGYGAMVNGVRTFSDGSGGSGAPPATMTRPQIDALAAGPSLSRADAGIGGGIESAALGQSAGIAGGFGSRPIPGAAIPSIASRPVADPTATARADNLMAQRFAATDASNAANRVPGSVAGDTARAAEINAGSHFGSRALRQAEAIGGVQNRNAIAEAGMKSQADLGIAGLQDAGATLRTGMDQQGQNQRNAVTANASITGDYLRKPVGERIPMADGTLGILGPDNVVRPATGLDGKPVTPERGKDPIDSTAYSKLVSESINRLLTDPKTGMQRATTAAEMMQATQAAKEQADVAFGRGGTPQASSAEGQVHVDANGNKAKLVNGKWVDVK